MRTFSAKPHEVNHDWYVVDASGKTLGRLATEIARRLARLARAPFMQLKEDEKYELRDVRCRTIGDISCTGLTLSTADTLEDIIQEVAAARSTERGGRYDDRRSEAAMEDRKKKGNF